MDVTAVHSRGAGTSFKSAHVSNGNGAALGSWPIKVDVFARKIRAIKAKPLRIGEPSILV
jgi:hypothetical protein